MLKIFKKKDTKNKFYDKKNWDEVINILKKHQIAEEYRLVNRPKEGEIVKISNIKIPKYLKIPSCWKLAQRKRYYQQYRYFRSPIILDEFGYLVDGYTTYLLAKEMKFEYITILRKW